MTLDRRIEPETIRVPRPRCITPYTVDICAEYHLTTEALNDRTRSVSGLDGIMVGGYRSYCVSSFYRWLYRRDPQLHPWRLRIAHNVAHVRPAVPVSAPGRERGNSVQSNALVFKGCLVHQICHQLSAFPTCK